MCNDIHTEQRQRVDMFHTQESKLRQDEIRSVHEVCVGGKVMIDIGKVREALKEIWNGMANRQGFVKEFKLIETTINELERLQEKEKPMKPIEIESRHYNCPNCEESISIEQSNAYNKTFYQFCNFCGQKLDWSHKE